MVRINYETTPLGGASTGAPQQPALPVATTAVATVPGSSTAPIVVPTALPRRMFPSTLRRSFTSVWVQRFLIFANIVDSVYYTAIFFLALFGPRNFAPPAAMAIFLSLFIVIVSCYGFVINYFAAATPAGVLYSYFPLTCVRGVCCSILAIQAYVAYFSYSEGATMALRLVSFLAGANIAPMNLGAAFVYFFWCRATIQERVFGPLTRLIDAGDQVVGSVVERPPTVVDAVIAESNSVPEFYRADRVASYSA